MLGCLRVVAGLLAVIAACGCTPEVYKGPRVVHYTETSFYVRHLPPLNGAETVDEIAADICRSRNAKPILREAYQDVPLDIRYAAYECI